VATTEADMAEIRANQRVRIRATGAVGHVMMRHHMGSERLADGAGQYAVQVQAGGWVFARAGELDPVPSGLREARP
jgi:hypothetical protein